jgi:hypothetical protein
MHYTKASRNFEARNFAIGKKIEQKSRGKIDPSLLIIVNGLLMTVLKLVILRLAKRSSKK